MQEQDESGTSDLGRTITYAGSIGKRFIAEQVDRRASLVATILADASTEILELGEDVRKRGNAVWLADAIEYAAAYTDKVSAYLKNSDGQALARDFESYAREKPAVVAVAALASGFALSRVLRVSTASQSNA